MGVYIALCGKQAVLENKKPYNNSIWLAQKPRRHSYARQADHRWEYAFKMGLFTEKWRKQISWRAVILFNEILFLLFLSSIDTNFFLFYCAT